MPSPSHNNGRRNALPWYERPYVTSDYEAGMALLFDQGQWFMLPKVLFKTDLDYGVIILLAYLLSRHCQILNKRRRDGTDYDGWFLCNGPKVEKDLGMSRKAQDALFHKLRKANLIVTQKRGFPPKRRVRINMDRVQQVLWQ